MKRILACISGLFLAGLLMLLTIGLPVTYSAVKKMKDDIAHNKKADDNNNPYSNSTEEKTPNNNLTINEEYVHGMHADLQLVPQQITNAYIHAHEATYIAYHGEMHCPPPNSLS